MSFTVNSLTSKGPWRVVDAYGTDVTTSSVILDDITGNVHLVRSIAIDFANIGNWIKIFDGTDLQIGPWESGSKHWSQVFVDGITFEEGVYIQTESAGKIHVTIEYQIVPGPGPL